MEFRLTYEGPLMPASRSATRPSHKHEIRREFHKQLKHYWAVHPTLVTMLGYDRMSTQSMVRLGISRVEQLTIKFDKYGYNFVPLITEDLALVCSIDILFLRPNIPGTIVKSGDLDNRLKTLFDALRMPSQKGELGGFDTPLPDEKPFYCLLEDDGLITHISVTTDTLLQPIGANFLPTDARLIISVKIKPHVMELHNIAFG